MDTGETILTDESLATTLYPKAGTSYNSDAKEIIMDDIQRKQIVDSNDIENRKTTTTTKDVSGQIPSDPNDGFWSGRKTGGTIVAPNTIVPGNEIKNNDIYGSFTVKEDADKVTSYENFWAGRKGIDNVYDPYSDTQGYSSNGDMSSNYQDVVAGEVSGYDGNSGGYKSPKYGTGKSRSQGERIKPEAYDKYRYGKPGGTQQKRNTKKYGIITNGEIPSELLFPVSIGNSTVYFEENAAKSWDKLVKLYKQSHGGKCFTVNEGYRPYTNTVEYYEDSVHKKKKTAAAPGTSQHGWGLALDIDMTQDLYDWLKKNGKSLNIIHPSWASVNKSNKKTQETKINNMFESWHWEYSGPSIYS
jgi:hypothetical protein